jgi:hypothetical protein
MSEHHHCHDSHGHHGEPAEPVVPGTMYTCPMHPEIRQQGPGDARFAAWDWSRRKSALKMGHRQN